MQKPKTTRTFGPIHFEDLDPHRFEDFIRELIYDFKDWKSIEATGRSGNDGGFDIRSFEKVELTTTETDNHEEVEAVHPMDGNLWMIQCKREKAIGPKKIQEILLDIDPENPPYGYILAASANFSKGSYDIFRDDLKKLGVMEFYLWGKAELEDMLHLPKNDRILFTFFGISLVSKRRSRTTEIRSVITIKNKLYRAVGEGQFSKHVLIRDLKDTHYPYKNKYGDFDKKPRWKEFIAFSHHPLGLLCHNHEYFAYVDIEKKEWDYTNEVDFVHSQVDDDSVREAFRTNLELAKDAYDFLPKKNQGHFIINSLAKYDDILLVDDKGDSKFDFPHLYIDFEGGDPFYGSSNTLKIGENEYDLDEGFKRISVFKKLKKKKFGKIYRDKNVLFNEKSLEEFNNFRINAIYDDAENYNYLKQGDVIEVAGQTKLGNGSGTFLQITNKYKIKISDYLKLPNDYNVNIHWIIKIQLGRDFEESEEINVYEFRRVYEHQFNKG